MHWLSGGIVVYYCARGREAGGSGWFVLAETVEVRSALSGLAGRELARSVLRWERNGWI